MKKPVALGREYIAHQLDAMKMAQSTLQQLMALSAGGLALFFGFIGKAAFVSTVDFFGVGVVTAWIASLCAAAYAHRVHSGLFASLIQLHVVVKNASLLDSLPDEVEAELKKNPNAEAVVQRAKEKLASERERLNKSFREFEQTFFPQQGRAFRAMRVSLICCGRFIFSLGILRRVTRARRVGEVASFGVTPNKALEATPETFAPISGCHGGALQLCVRLWDKHGRHDYDVIDSSCHFWRKLGDLVVWVFAGSTKTTSKEHHPLAVERSRT